MTDTGRDTLNNKIEVAWLKLREAERGLSLSERRTYRTRMIHVIADQLDTNIERVRQRIDKIERGLKLKPEDALREISLLWARRINAGQAFLASTDDVPRMRELLKGYTHPDEVNDATE